MKTKIIIGILLILISALFYYLSPSQKKNTSKSTILLPSVTPTVEPINQNNINPGQTNLDELIASKGEPTKKTTFNNQTIYNYQTSVKNWFDQFYVRDNIVELVIEPIFAGDERTKDVLFSKYGSPQLILFGELSGGGKDLFVYPSLGVAILASNYTNIVYEFWSFLPVSKDDFIAQIAIPHHYSLTEPTPKE